MAAASMPEELPQTRSNHGSPMPFRAVRLRSHRPLRFLADGILANNPFLFHGNILSSPLLIRISSGRSASVMPGPTPVAAQQVAASAFHDLVARVGPAHRAGARAAAGSCRRDTTRLRSPSSKAGSRAVKRCSRVSAARRQTPSQQFGSGSGRDQLKQGASESKTTWLTMKQKVNQGLDLMTEPE